MARLDLTAARHGLTVLALALFGSAAACAPEEATPVTLGTKSSRIFFQNSNRRDATAQEASRVAHLPTSGCTAFFLENSANKVYLGTARHCFQFKVTEWCQNDGVLRDNAGNQGRCTRVVAGDREHDITVFEANIPHASTGDTTLRLAKFLAPVETRLIMTGYPGDQDPQNPRNGALTTTENCWTLSGIVPNEHILSGEQGGPTDKWQKHNCSTYGGNSGGPMYIQGTRTVIGLPSIYSADDYARRSPTDLSTAAGLDLMLDFASVHEAALTAAGISITTSIDEPDPSADADAEDPSEDDDADEDEEEEEAPKKKKKKSTPRPTAPVVQSGCSAAPTGTSAGPAFGLFALSAAAAVVARRRRQPRP